MSVFDYKTKNAHPVLRGAAILIAAATFLALPPLALQAADQTANELIIKDGTFVDSHGKISDATLLNIVDDLRNKYPEANIVMGPDIGKSRIQFLRYREGADPDGRSLELELRALSLASDGKFNVFVQSYPVGNSRGVYFLQPTQPARSEKVVEVFNLTSCIERRFSEWQRKESERRALPGKNLATDQDSLQRFWDEEKVERSKTGKDIASEIRDIVESTASSLGVDAKQLNFNFHGGADLLVVIGPQEAIDVARKVVDAMLERPSKPADIVDVFRPGAPPPSQPPRTPDGPQHSEVQPKP